MFRYDNPVETFLYIHIKQHKIRYLLLVIGVVWFYFLLPSPLFQSPYSTLATDRNGSLLGARIASDGQWRFPLSDSLPYKYRQAVVLFEDAWFYRHPGINPVSLFKAVIQDIKAGKIVRGGSTITMQVARMARGNQKRNVYQKIMEMIWALRIELAYSKKEILNIYASHAPFGGNVVGLEAAAWRYFGRSPDKLSWGETAVLAVLPNAPSLIYPGKNQTKLLRKRNRLLDKLYSKHIIDSVTCELAKSEKLPQKPGALPQITPHLLNRLPQGQKTKTTINKSLQLQVNELTKRHHKYLSANKIYNMAVLVVSVKTGEVLAYTGNVSENKKDKGSEVDIIFSRRSTGSILKPFLYAWALKDGLILPHSLLKDVPTQIAGYHPENYNKTYDGMVPADEALARSLNIPAVRLLRDYGLEKFHDNLQQIGLKTIDKSAGHYGLTLILGGAETRLWDMVKIYAGMGRSLNRFGQTGQYYKDNYIDPVWKTHKNLFQNSKVDDNPPFGADNIWFVFEALARKDRPVEGDDWNIYRSARKIAWKTGTSFGHRDAWCVGVTPDYAVGVWVGNASGEGRPGLTGTQVAAPVLFDVFKLLPQQTTWFQKPEILLKKTAICAQSGYLASANCEKILIEQIPQNGERTKVCPYHKIIHLNREGTRRVNSDCYPVVNMQTQKYFVLPPVAAWYYRKKHSNYHPLPPWDSNCLPFNEKNMDLIYPKTGVQLFLPKDFNKLQQKVVFKAVHRQSDASIYWHLNERYIGQTKGLHHLELYIKPGTYTLTLVDDKGETLTRQFEVVVPR